MKKFAALIVLALLGGCATSLTPNYDAKFGDAVRQARLKMTINPDAGTNPDQVTGMDGKSARETILLYQGTYKAPPPAVNVINIGGGIGGGN
ncbi:MAG: hypothetical protein Q8K05_17595 [Polaromonas sp.]|uniref:hypothetical protein n=1 Tax=Polaromonas sp. TaxID=1869339 RepID=UPI0027315F82|nr:hypothetical protein [Polaromonas sp.]MDP2257837.1 hypothetical protein [Polaromonas sp.]